MSRANDGTEKRNKSREKSNALRRERRGTGQEPLGFTELPPEAIDKLIHVVLACGGAVQFGLTRDYGAAMVRFYLNGESETVYYRPSDDIEGEFDEWVTHFTRIWQEQTDPSRLPPPGLADAVLRRLGV